MKTKLWHQRKTGLLHTRLSLNAGFVSLLYINLAHIIVKDVPTRKEYVPCVARRSLRPRTTDKHQFERKGQFTEHRMKRIIGGIILQT